MDDYKDDDQFFYDVEEDITYVYDEQKVTPQEPKEPGLAAVLLKIIIVFIAFFTIPWFVAIGFLLLIKD